jgi:two-component system cell cycle sensor histidine kinase/response regulator CckA
MARSPIVPPSRAFEIARIEIAQLPPETTLDRTFAAICEHSARAVGIERVGIWLFVENRSLLRCSNLYELSKDEHSSGALLRVADFPDYFSSLQLRKAIPAEVAATEPWTAGLATSYLNPLGISSMLDAGVFVDGVLVGVICHEHVGPPREWTTEERDFVGSMADLLAARIQSAEMRELRAAFLTQRDRIAALEKSVALEHLAAGVAHDFRNLLTVVLGHGDLLAKRNDLSADARSHVAQMVGTAERGVALSTELLDFARPVTKPPTVIDVASVAHECLPLLKAKAGPRHPIQFSAEPAMGQVLIEKSQLTRLLMNLVINAVEAMPNGGPIRIRFLPVRLTGNPIYTGRFIELDVTDTGMGMDEETQRRAFDPFFTSKKHGTGLGLAIVRQIVERNGGLIRIDSNRGTGTTFRIFFPRIGASKASGTEIVAIPPELRLQDVADERHSAS